jgi:hypothetical protein
VRLSDSAAREWQQLAPKLHQVFDVTTFKWPALLAASKDRPVLFTAAAFSNVLLTLDRADFGALMEGGFYGLAVLTPGDFLRRERDAGRLRPEP